MLANAKGGAQLLVKEDRLLNIAAINQKKSWRLMTLCHLKKN